MKTYLSFFTLLSVCCLPPGTWAQTKQPKQEKAASLSDVMEDLNAAYRRLGRQVRNPARNEDSLRLVGILRETAELSATLEPELTVAQPAEQREAFLENYRRAMQEFLATVDKLEAALKKADNAAATKLVDTLKELRNEGHKRYKKPDDD